MPRSPDSGQHQNVARASRVLSALAEGCASGLRLVDVMQMTGLGRASAHRVLSGLVAHGLAEHDRRASRYFLGTVFLQWVVTARERFDLSRLIEPALVRLCDKTQDTVYLTSRAGDEAVCVYRREGAFPIKALTLDVGDRRPLGVGTGSLALLAFLPDPEIERLLQEQKDARAPYMFDLRTLRRLIAEARTNDYAFNDIHILPSMSAIQGMSGIALPVRRSDGTPICAISVVAITGRMRPPRRDDIVAMMRKEIGRIETELQPLLAM
jgi:DNA-binding IclR family transcriptional regulator